MLSKCTSMKLEPRCFVVFLESATDPCALDQIKNMEVLYCMWISCRVYMFSVLWECVCVTVCERVRDKRGQHDNSASVMKA